MADFKVRCVEAKKLNGNSIGFTTGRIYSVVNGKLIDDDGIGHPVMSNDKINSLEDIKNRKDGDWSWIGRFERATSATSFSFINR